MSTASYTFLNGGGQAGGLIRAVDWSATAMGSPEQWPESLRSAISISLNSGFPIAIYWGQEFTLVYNDAWSSIPGDKHPWALGKPGAVVWPEIWDGLKDQFNAVLRTGESIRQPDALLLMNRYGYKEECYFDYTLSPIVASDGGVGGVFNAVIETTYRHINERRNALLLSFWENLNRSAGVAEAAELICAILNRAPDDICFCALFSGSGPEGHAVPLSGHLSIPGESLPIIASLAEGTAFSGKPLKINGLDAYLPGPIMSSYDEPVKEAVIVPISNGDTRLRGYMVLGVSPRKRLDDEYMQFMEAVGRQAGTILNNAYGNEINDAYLREQALNEELAAANEELAATNEELHQAQQRLNGLTDELEAKVVERTRELEESYEEQQALNEEINAANEELTSANEELAATNEELSETQIHLQRTLAGLAESDERFRNLVRDASVGIILVTGKDLTTLIVNDTYARLIGRTVAELENRPLFDIIPEATSTFRPVIERVRDVGEPLYLADQPYIVYKDGGTINGFLNVTYQPYRESNGKVTGVMVLCQDVTEQFISKRKLELSEERFRFMLNAIPQQVWTATPDGALNYVNEVVAEDFGEDGGSIVGQGWQKFIHPDDAAATLNTWQKALASGREYQVEFRLRMKNGNYIWHLARALPYREGGKIVSWLGTNTNIEIQKSNEQKKDEFLSIASHELKTPLTSIKAFNQIMRRMNKAENLGTFIEKSAHHLFRLEKLINDLLDVTRINAGKMVYDIQPFGFKEMLLESIESVQLKSERHAIILEKADDVDFNGDRLRLEQVMTNILTNAVKYSPEATRVVVNAAVQDNGIVVSVQDFGIGIAKEHIEHLFGRYYRVDNTAMRFEGLGLGLYISSEIIKRHDGTLWIESTEGEGSTFYFRLPLQTNEEDRITEYEGYYGDRSITIEHNVAHFRLDVDWKGFQNVESVQRGGMKMLEMLTKAGASKVLNDNTHVLGSWSEASDWAAQVWFPQMAAAGLKYFAWVYSPSTFSRMSAEKAADTTPGLVETRFFGDPESGAAWLDEKV
ncbi:ATP-binding protein [Mucilaginibacter pedocola]|uniref:histidine kinase n=1 Tax=Mucilaginibacter pedocola TaxID=1792845 RepID=A0A1S9PDH4_9SPHI|nr:ATP-binding protein [Mucilaginibacter pedocola]OOQ58969.1 hypothetical protein BC343_30085 [Mucilaginibacter pedocola]